VRVEDVMKKRLVLIIVIGISFAPLAFADSSRVGPTQNPGTGGSRCEQTVNDDRPPSYADQHAVFGSDSKPTNSGNAKKAYPADK
jgi:hypothetical protein